MADPKDNTSFFRKVVKFVANPTTEWAEIGSPADELREADFAKSELKAMIERKRRNDFVRKREFDMLRKVRREGLTSEQLAALGGSSKLDDSDAAKMQMDASTRADSGVKAKIDEIEQQMVGDSMAAPLKRNTDFYNAPTQPAPMQFRQDDAPFVAAPPPAPTAAPMVPPPRPPLAPEGGRVVDDNEFALPPITTPARAAAATPARPTPPAAAPAPPALTALSLNPTTSDFGDPFAVEVNEVAHDPDLDEAVISFANADFEQCEASLAALTGAGGVRAGHAETWLVLFDLYRATGQQHKFESLALDYAQTFGWSAPQWFSLPRLVAEAVAEERPARSPSRIDGQIGWVCPEYLDAEAVARLGSQTLQMPLPWVFDWAALKGIDVEGCVRLSELFRKWMGQKLDMRWLGGERLLTVLQDAAPTGVRDADPAYWQLRLDALRMANRPDQFDEAAIDYCVTYEVSPPSWEAAQCKVRISNSSQSTASPPMSQVSDVTTSFLESRIIEDAGMMQVATVELSGQLVGDIGATLKKLETELHAASIVNVSCSRLIRVDFIAAGDLLNWVLARRTENRAVSFVEAHRLVALFFGAMGINEHAKVKVRNV